MASLTPGSPATRKAKDIEVRGSGIVFSVPRAVAVDEALPSSDPIETDPSIEIEHGQGHTHPKKHHKPKNPEHTHPKKEHAPRNEPAEGPHAHPKKEHGEETEFLISDVDDSDHDSGVAGVLDDEE